MSGFCLPGRHSLLAMPVPPCCHAKQDVGHFVLLCATRAILLCLLNQEGRMQVRGWIICPWAVFHGAAVVRQPNRPLASPLAGLVPII